MTCLIEFEAPEEMDCVKGKDIPENKVKAYYIGADGMPFIGFEMINPNYGYKTYSFFNEVKGYFKPNDDEVEYMMNATPVTSDEYYKAMLAKMS